MMRYKIDESYLTKDKSGKSDNNNVLDNKITFKTLRVYISSHEYKLIRK